MKKNYNNPIERLIEYNSLLRVPGINTIQKLHEVTKIPLQTIRADIREQLCSPIPFIIPEDDSEDIEFVSPNNDNSTIEIVDLFDEHYEELISVPVNVEEYLAFQNIYEQTSFHKKVQTETNPISSTIRNKKYVCEFSPHIITTLDELEYAITNKLQIKLEYMVKTFVEEHLVSPQKIGFDATENRYVLIGLENYAIRIYDLEYIMNSRVFKPDEYIKHTKLDKIADKVWGFEYDKCFDENNNILPPTRVKVKFYNEANVIQKVMRDLTHRNPLAIDSTPEGDLIYIDNVYGIESFKTWIYSFGSSAEVLKPTELRNSIAEELESFYGYIKARN